VISTPGGSDLARRAHQQGFAVAEMSWADLRARVKRVNVLHAHTGRAQNIAWFASLGAAVTRIVTRHVAFKPNYPLIHRLKYANTCDGVIAVSRAVERALLDAGVPAGRIATIPTGVEIPAAVPDAEERARARCAWNLADEDFAVVFEDGGDCHGCGCGSAAG